MDHKGALFFFAFVGVHVTANADMTAGENLFQWCLQIFDAFDVIQRVRFFACGFAIEENSNAARGKPPKSDGGTPIGKFNCFGGYVQAFGTAKELCSHDDHAAANDPKWVWEIDGAVYQKRHDVEDGNQSQCRQPNEILLGLNVKKSIDFDLITRVLRVGHATTAFPIFILP